MDYISKVIIENLIKLGFLKENEVNEYVSVRGYKGKNDDSYILGNLNIDIYPNDRDNMTPHCHIYDVQSGNELEVSLVDNKILNIKGVDSKFNDWGYYKDIEDRYFAWLKATKPNRLKNDGSLMTNAEYMKKIWNLRNPNSKYKFDENTWELKSGNDENPNNSNPINPEALRILSKKPKK